MSPNTQYFDIGHDKKVSSYGKAASPRRSQSPSSHSAPDPERRKPADTTYILSYLTGVTATGTSTTAASITRVSAAASGGSGDRGRGGSDKPPSIPPSPREAARKHRHGGGNGGDDNDGGDGHNNKSNKQEQKKKKGKHDPDDTDDGGGGSSSSSSSSDHAPDKQKKKMNKLIKKLSRGGHIRIKEKAEIKIPKIPTDANGFVFGKAFAGPKSLLPAAELTSA